jgi:hypothetical protein
MQNDRTLLSQLSFIKLSKTKMGNELRPIPQNSFVTPKGFEPLSEEPESSILSIKLRGRDLQQL